MDAGRAHSASNPPAFPDAADAIDWASMMVIFVVEGLYEGWRVR